MYLFPVIEVEAAYKRCGWNVNFFTQTAVSNHNGTMQFFSDHDYQYLEWGGTILGNTVDLTKHSTNLLLYNGTNLQSHSGIGVSFE
jgi:hypothetical protein